jgi:uncharacterized protein YprB with RNaseH-like and TPR domain
VITASFRHIHGVGAMRERQLWMRGIGGWDAFPAGEVLAPALDGRLREGIAESRTHLSMGDLAWFAERLPEAEHWRLLPQVIEDAGFLDVETADDVTVIGVLDRDGPHCFVRGRDLDGFPARAARWRAIVTFNGTACDLPHLRRRFPGWHPPSAHVDLCHALRRVGERGGLKDIEPRLGLYRPPHLARLGGEDAVWLWHAQRAGDPAALRRLIEYNLHDTFHLRPLAEIAYNRLVRRSRMPAPELPVSERGAMLYDVSRAVERALGTSPRN